MTLLRLLLVVEPHSTLSAVSVDDVLEDISASGGEVETANDVGQVSFIAIAAWSDWRGLAEWWTSARARADAAGLTVRGLILDSPIPAHDGHAGHPIQAAAAANNDLWFGEFSTAHGSPELVVADTARTRGSGP